MRRGRISAKVILVIVALGAAGTGIWFWLQRDRPSYESGFADYIWIEFPKGQSLAEWQDDAAEIDRLLREQKVGYLSGVSSQGDPPEVREVELAVNPEFIKGESVLDDLIGRGWLPENVSFEVGTYPRPWPDS